MSPKLKIPERRGVERSHGMMAQQAFCMQSNCWDNVCAECIFFADNKKAFEVWRKENGEKWWTKKQ